MRVGAHLSSPAYLDGLLAVWAKHVAEIAQVTFCRIGLLDEAGEVLSIRATYSARALPKEFTSQARYELSNLPKHSRAVQTRQAIIVRHDVPLLAVHEEERKVLSEELESAALVPLFNGDRVLGMLILGEARSWERSPFDADKVKILEYLAASMANTLTYIELLRRIVQAYECLHTNCEQETEVQRDRAIAEFALAVADDLAQPLTSAWGFAQLLLKETDTMDNMRREPLLRILENCERIGAIVQRLRSLSYPVTPFEEAFDRPLPPR